MGRKYTVEELKAQDPEKWTDEYIQEWGSRSGKVEGIERGSSGPEAAAADPASGTNHAKDTRGKTKFQVTGSMVEIGQVSAGLSGGIGRVRPKTEGAAVLYDDATGKIYETTKWKDLDRNRNYLVDAQGRRQRIAGYAAAGDGGVYSIHNKANPGTQWVLAGYNEEVPEAGTEEFQEYVAKKFETSAMAQAIGNRVRVGEDGKVEYPKTELGQYATMSSADWIKMGRPGKVGNFSMHKYKDLSDDDLLARGGLLLQDTKDRAHGIEKAINKVGKLWGDSNFGHELMRVATDIGRIPLLGDLSGLNLVVRPINAYESARDAGKSAQSAAKEGAKAGVDAFIDTQLAAAKLAAAVATTAATGGAGAPLAIALIAGAAAGAATEYAGSMASSAKQRMIFGSGNTMYGAAAGEDALSVKSSHQMQNRAGKAAAVGAITGAAGRAAAWLTGPGAGVFTKTGVGQSPFAGSGALELFKGGNMLKGLNMQSMFGEGAVGRWAGAGVKGGASYLASRHVMGASNNDPFMWAGVASAAFNPDKIYDGEAISKGNAYIANGMGAFEAFREISAQTPLLSGVFGRGTRTRRHIDFLMSKDRETPVGFSEAVRDMKGLSVTELMTRRNLSRFSPYQKLGNGALGWLDDELPLIMDKEA